MAFFELMHAEEMRPAVGADIMASLDNLTNKIEIGQKHIRSEDRRTNIKVAKGLIRDHFVKVDVATLAHGPGLLIDFENSIRRSRTETGSFGIVALQQLVDPTLAEGIVADTCAAVWPCARSQIACTWRAVVASLQAL